MRTVDAWTLAQEIFGRGATPQQVHLAYTFIVAARGTFVGYNNNWDEEYSVDEVVLALKAADMTSDIIRGSDRMLVKGNPSAGVLVNATPHSISLYRREQTVYNPEVRKFIINAGSLPYRVINQSGMILSATAVEEDAGEIDGVPIRRVVWNASPLPPGDDTYIVSALYKNASADGDRDRLVTVGGVVYDSAENPKPVGCLYLVR